MTISPPDYHKFDQPIESIAVIGAGASGAPAARHLRDSGLRVRVFERQSTAGGIWNWSPDVTLPLSVPTPPPSLSAFSPKVPHVPLGSEPSKTTLDDPTKAQRLKFSPPNPVYWSLSNNVPTSTMAFKDFSYPPNTPENISHEKIAGYVRDYVKHFQLDSIISYNTRVEKIVKVTESSSVGPKWRLTLRQLEPTSEGSVTESFWTEDFDAVVIATGHYNAPYIPAIEGSSEWADAWPERILHSNGYRIPEPFKNKDILIVGIGTSGIDIARDLSPLANKVYMVGKDELRGPEGYQGMRKWQRQLLPTNGEAVSEIKRFIAPSPGSPVEEGQIELSDGRILSGISLVIFATGYQYSYPFLPQLHHDPENGEPTEEAKQSLLITDGGGVLNLYRDVFFNPDPTLAFLGLSVNTSAFSFFEYQSLSIVRVFTQKARLPSLTRRQEAYAELVKTKGEGKFSHFLGQQGERSYVKETVDWLNLDAEWSGAEQVIGHTPEWLAASDNILPSIAAKYGIDPEAMREMRGLKKSVVPTKVHEKEADLIPSLQSISVS